MTNHVVGSPAKRHVGILDYWHKIEFFIPYDLQGQVLEAADAEWSVKLLSARDLERQSVHALWSFKVPDDRKLTRFDVYLGIFDKAELADVTRRIVNQELGANEAIEQDERGELEGLTCAASLRVNASGELNLDELKVSTVPWALGRIAAHGLKSLDFGGFRADLDALQRDVITFRTTLGDALASIEGGDRRCTSGELTALLRLLSRWAGHDLSGGDAGAPAVVIHARSIKKDDNAEKAGSPAEPAKAVADGHDDDEEDDEQPHQELTEIGILNSFFAEDLARAAASLQQGSASVPLQAYLTPRPLASRLDLYRDKGPQAISEGLRPKHLNRGRWPGNPAHKMSLMQQFAVNSIFNQLRDPGLFSVNGPPGTGKTTLLREVFAENLVRRARVLAKCATARDAFVGKSRAVSFVGEQDCTVHELREELTGFEMVVASTNNAAVENISKDLPRTKALGKALKPNEKGWRDASGRATFSYLQPVARNLFERTRGGGYTKPVSGDEDTWGLFSCALGKQGNRSAFVRGLSFAGGVKGAKKPLKYFDPTRHQTIWTWRNGYAGATFAEAKRAFAAADEAANEWIARLDRFATLDRGGQVIPQEDYCGAAARAVIDADAAHLQANVEFGRLDEEWNLCKRQLELLQTERALIETRRPGWWTRMRNRQAKAAHDAELADNGHKLSTWVRKQYEVEPTRESARRILAAAAAVARKAQAQLDAQQRDWRRLAAEYGVLKHEFPEAKQTLRAADLDADDWQVGGLWHSEVVNEKRSALLVAALQLHEAWLAEALQQSGGLGGNVVALCHLLKGRRLQDPIQALSIWRSLFMIVPVVSCTFASFARQFRDLGPSSIGWLFVDEAGQAVPQAAVGALWRAQRAVVVGDPLQIEPVFTVPIKLLEALAKASDLPGDMTVTPDKTSVQNLADEANALGAIVGGEGQSRWVGSPLRVHRRCVDPMFSIANEIAYQGKMIFFDPRDPSARQPPADSLDIGPSAWVQAGGETSYKQLVEDQVGLVYDAVLALYSRVGRLPPLYIITPFKSVKKRLFEVLSEWRYWQADLHAGTPLPKQGDLREWCEKHIGTVHTFQGKEEDIVWLVLGCDDRTAGAADWAASKPNLLNVAVTRAKHRCFIIGDEALWGGRGHFAAARAGHMPRITPQQFMQRIRQGP